MRHPYVPILMSRRKSGTSCFRGYKRSSYICFPTNYREFSLKKSGMNFDFYCLESRFIFDCLDQTCGFTGKIMMYGSESESE